MIGIFFICSVVSCCCARSGQNAVCVPGIRGHCLQKIVHSQNTKIEQKMNVYREEWRRKSMTRWKHLANIFSILHFVFLFWFTKTERRKYLLSHALSLRPIASWLCAYRTFFLFMLTVYIYMCFGFISLWMCHAVAQICRDILSGNVMIFQFFLCSFCLFSVCRSSFANLIYSWQTRASLHYSAGRSFSPLLS